MRIVKGLFNALLQGRNRLGVLVTLDAFGTLYRPRENIGTAYRRLAQETGLRLRASDADVNASFLKAFKQQWARHPNYGNASDASLSQAPRGDCRIVSCKDWWDDVVQGTFRPLLGPGQTVPYQLSERLWCHYSGSQGYELFPDAQRFLQQLRELRQNFCMGDKTRVKLVVGVLSNSDDRVLGILRSLGIKVDQGPPPDFMKFTGIAAQASTVLGYNPTNDIDFVVTSYENGHPKPSKEIFKDAQKRGAFLLVDPQTRKTFEIYIPFRNETIHVGDDRLKDFEGAKDVGWDAYLLQREPKEATEEDEVISSLEEVGMALQILANQHIQKI